jgi:hypothetical protein
VSSSVQAPQAATGSSRCRRKLGNRLGSPRAASGATRRLRGARHLRSRLGADRHVCRSLLLRPGCPAGATRWCWRENAGGGDWFQGLRSSGSEDGGQPITRPPLLQNNRTRSQCALWVTGFMELRDQEYT